MKIIGIDPAFRVSGFGICELDENSVYFPKIKTFIDFFYYAKSFMVSDAQIFVVENSNLQNTTFTGYKANAKQLQRISRNVGANQAVSQMVVDYLRYLGLEVVEVSPLQKGSKWNLYQAQSALFDLKISPSKRKMSQDERDALKLAYQEKKRRNKQKNKQIVVNLKRQEQNDMTNQEQKQQEREALQAIAHFSGKFNTGVYYYQINYWQRIWDRCNPFLFSNDSKEKEHANNFMLNVLEYHLQNTINMDERKRILDKIRMLK